MTLSASLLTSFPLFNDCHCYLMVWLPGGTTEAAGVMKAWKIFLRPETTLDNPFIYDMIVLHASTINYGSTVHLRTHHS